MTDAGPGAERVEDETGALVALRTRAITRLFPGSVHGIQDAAQELLPRIVGAEVAFRSRLLEELATLQLLLLQEAIRGTHQPATLPQIVAQLRGLISDQLKIVKDAPLGTGREGATHQAADLLARRAYVVAEIRRRGLSQLLDQHGQPAAQATIPAHPGRDPRLAAILALAASGAGGDALELEHAGADADPARAGGSGGTRAGAGRRRRARAGRVS